MSNIEPVSIINKLSDVTIQEFEFTDKETSEIIEYKRVVLHLEVDGEETTMQLVPAKAEGKSAYSVLKLAKDL